MTMHVIEKEIVIKDRLPWFNTDVKIAKREKRRAEYLWRRRRTSDARKEYREAKNRYNVCVRNRKREYFMNKIKEEGKHMNKLYVILDNLTGCKRKNKLPEGFNNHEI